MALPFDGQPFVDGAGHAALDVPLDVGVDGSPEIGFGQCRAGGAGLEEVVERRPVGDDQLRGLDLIENVLDGVPAHPARVARVAYGGVDDGSHRGVGNGRVAEEIVVLIVSGDGGAHACPSSCAARSGMSVDDLAS